MLLLLETKILKASWRMQQEENKFVEADQV